jgi:hypothetical protein
MALLKFLALGNRQVAEEKVTPAVETIEGIRDRRNMGR